MIRCILNTPPKKRSIKSSNFKLNTKIIDKISIWYGFGDTTKTILYFDISSASEAAI